MLCPNLVALWTPQPLNWGRFPQICQPPWRPLPPWCPATLPPSEEALRFLSRRVTPLRSPGDVAGPNQSNELSPQSIGLIRSWIKFVDLFVDLVKSNRSRINQSINQSELMKYFRPSPQNCPPGPSSSSLLWRRPGRRSTQSHGVTRPQITPSFHGQWSSLGRSIPIYGSHGMLLVSLILDYTSYVYQWYWLSVASTRTRSLCGGETKL